MPQPDQLAHFVQGMIDRNEESLADFYDCTLTKVYGLALKITKRHDLAEEVTEDTYMQVWLEAAKFDSNRGCILAWVTTICRSRSIDALRRLDIAESMAEPETLKLETESKSNPLDILLALERETDVYVAMTFLKPTERQLIALAFFKGYTHEEIANHMQMPLGSVKSLIKRAQSKLRSALF